MKQDNRKKLSTIFNGEGLCTVNVRKKGVKRGGQVYDDDHIVALMWVGWSYRDLVNLSQGILRQLDREGRTIGSVIAAAAEDGHEVDLETACVAVQSVRESFWRSLADKSGEGQESKRSEWYKPLERPDGRIVKGVKVYKGPERDDDPRAPKPGTLYLHGLKLDQRVLESAHNGHWETNHRPKTIAKNALTSRLPVGMYASYVIDDPTQVRFGAEAAEYAEEVGLSVDLGVIQALFSLRHDA